MDKKINWKAWASVLASTFLGAALAFYGMPHEGMAVKELLLGAALAGISAVVHLLQQPHHVTALPAVAPTEAPKEDAQP